MTGPGTTYGLLALLRPCGTAPCRPRRTRTRAQDARSLGPLPPSSALTEPRQVVARRVRHLPASDRSDDGTARSDAQGPREAGERQDGWVAGGVSLQAWAPPPCPLRARVSLCPGGRDGSHPKFSPLTGGLRCRRGYCPARRQVRSSTDTGPARLGGGRGSWWPRGVIWQAPLGRTDTGTGMR